jgi:pimeloyl-ACP methyl ester carboxylesterase
MFEAKGTPSVVLVHGAWADGSSWNDVTGPLIGAGLNVLSAPIPLTSLSDDVAALDRALEPVGGAVVLVAHAYAGAVIAATANERIRALVYVTALAPDEGETVAEVFYREKPHPQAPQLAPDAHGFIWMPPGCICRRVRSERIPRTYRAFCRDPTAASCYLAATCIQGKVPRRVLEGKAFVVPRRRGRPDDQPGDAAFHGGSHGRPRSLGKGGPHADGDGPAAGHRDHPRCRPSLTDIVDANGTGPLI